MKNYLIYWLRMGQYAAKGTKTYYSWIAFLTILFLVGLGAYWMQIQHGLSVSNLTDQVSWGVYIANFAFLVGVAAAAVLLVFPAYIMHIKEIKNVVLIGQQMAFAAVVMCLLFVVVDLGQPEKFTHLLPLIGKIHFPLSVLAWDVITLNGYLLLNLYIPAYLIYKMYRNQEPNQWLYLPLVMISIFWALSIQTVEAFLFSGLAGRPFWNTAVLAPRFIVSAFAAGPALLTIIFGLVKFYTKLQVHEYVFNWLRKIMMIFLPINMFLFGAEIFKEFYTDNTHTLSMRYLLFGINGHGMLQVYIWSSLIMSTLAMIILFTPSLRKKPALIYASCLMSFVGVWIEKGMGLIIPGFIPTPLGDLVEYRPSLVEFFVSLGIWALGALIFTVLTKVTVAIQVGDLRET